jgi:hypothetical protein
MSRPHKYQATFHRFSQSKSTTTSQAKSAPTMNVGSGNQDAVALLTADHRAVEQLFEQYQETSDQSQKSDLARQIGVELIVHSKRRSSTMALRCS